MMHLCPKYVQTRVEPVDPKHLLEQRLVTTLNGIPVGNEYKLIRTRIIQQIIKDKANTIMITSPSAGEGKTVTAANLAVTFAKELGHTVLLIDCNLTNPYLADMFNLRRQSVSVQNDGGAPDYFARDKSRVSEMFNLKSEAGLVDCLLDDMPLKETLVNPGIDKLLILPAGKRILNSAELLNSYKMSALLKDIKGRYKDRFIIIDGPPVLRNADAIILSNYVDGIILVVEAGKTRVDQLQEAADLLMDKRILGTILNKAKYNRN